jgi:hypothetical protein
MPPLLPILALLLPSTAAASTVVLDGTTWSDLQPPEEPRPAKAPGAYAADRTVQIEVVEGGYRIVARWRVINPGREPFGLPVTNEALSIDKITWNGRPLGLKRSETITDRSVRWLGGGAVLDVHEGASGILTALIEDGSSGELVVEAFFATLPDDNSASFGLMPAAVGAVTVRGVPAGQRAIVEQNSQRAIFAEGRFWARDEQLTLRLAPKEGPRVRETLVAARADVGLTLGEAELRGKARIRWSVKQGTIEEARVSLQGVGADVVVKAEGLRESRREGDVLILVPEKPLTHGLVAELSWRAPVASGAEASLSLPRIEPLGVFKSESSLQLAREDADLELVPDLDAWRPVTTGELPKGSDGLVEGAVTSAFMASGSPGGTLGLLRFVPVEQPPVVVDVAAHTVGINEDGSALYRSYLTVRNERAASLRIVAPEGTRWVSVQVSGAPVTPATDGGPGWLVPLPRSLETVEGMLSFPIEVVAMGQIGGWAGKTRALALPRIDADVAVQRVTVHLPEGYDDKTKAGEHDVVKTFTEGVTTIRYGDATGDAGAAEVDRQFQEALAAYMDNDLSGAKQKLDDIREKVGLNENMSKLEANLRILDVDEVVGQAEASEDTNIARRVKGQAMARAQRDNVLQDELLQEADEAWRAGDYDKASSSYGRAAELGTKLSGLEQTESAEVRGRASVASSNYKMAQKRVAEVEAEKKKAEAKRESAQEAQKNDAQNAVLQSLQLKRQSRRETVKDAPEKPRVVITNDLIRIDMEDEPEEDDGGSGGGRYDFTGMEIDGELVKPNGEYAIGSGTFQPEAPPSPADHPSMAGGTSNENAYALDGVNVSDPVTGGDSGEERAVGFLFESEVSGLGVYGMGEGGGGVAEGMLGGLAGGVAGVVLHGAAAEPTPAPLEKEYLQKIPSGRSFQSSVTMVPGTTASGKRAKPVDTTASSMAVQIERRRGPLRSPKNKGKGKADRATAPPPPPPPPVTIAVESDVPVVKAASMSMIVPVMGDTVRFQKLLLPSGAEQQVLITFKHRLRDRSSK